MQYFLSLEIEKLHLALQLMRPRCFVHAHLHSSEHNNNLIFYDPTINAFISFIFLKIIRENTFNLLTLLLQGPLNHMRT